MSKKVRNSSIELLRILAIILIIASHATNYIMQGDVWSLGGGGSFRFLEVIGIWGQFGCVLFIIISSWFLCDASSFDFRHTARLGMMTWIACLLIVIVDLCCEKRLSAPEIIKELLTPVYDQYWFVTTYLFFSLLEPFVRRWNQNSSPEFRLKLVIVLTVLIPFYNLIFAASPGYHLADFFYVYFLTSHLKLSGENRIERHAGAFFGISVFGVWLLVHISGILLRKTQHTSMLNGLYNRLWGITPLIILGAISLFYLAEKKTFYSKSINFFGKRTLGVYVLHENFLMRGGSGKASLLWDELFCLSARYKMTTLFPICFIISILLTFFVAAFIDDIMSWITERVISVHVLNDMCVRITEFYSRVLKISGD